MGLFSKKRRFLSLTDDEEEQDETGEINEENKNSEVNYPAGSPEDRKRRLMKRLINISEKLEDLSTQIYHLQQRIEVLEKKTGVGREE